MFPAARDPYFQTEDISSMSSNQRWLRTRSAGVDPGQSLNFRMEQGRSQSFWFEPESSLMSVQEPIKIFKGANICKDACCCQTEWN